MSICGIEKRFKRWNIDKIIIDLKIAVFVKQRGRTIKQVCAERDGALDVLMASDNHDRVLSFRSKQIKEDLMSMQIDKRRNSIRKMEYT